MLKSELTDRIDTALVSIHYKKYNRPSLLLGIESKLNNCGIHELCT